MGDGRRGGEAEEKVEGRWKGRRREQCIERYSPCTVPIINTTQHYIRFKMRSNLRST
jgi:hypothetical protein